MPFSRLLIGAALTIASVSIARADEEAQQPNSADAPAAIEKVTVVGTRNPRSAQTYPGQVDVLNQDQIEAAIPSTVSDLVKDMPNVDFGGGPRRTGESPSIRGLGGQDVLVLIDGVRQSWTSGHDGRFFLDPDLLVGVEVVKGPASALYGSGALGGVMAFRTANASDLLDPGADVGLRATLGYQDVNNEFLRGLTGFTHQGDFDVIANVARRTSGDIKLGSGFDLQADDDVVTGFAKVGYSAGEEFAAQLSYQGFRNDAVEPDNGQGVSTGTPFDKTISMDQFSGHFSWKPASASFVNLNFVPYHVDGSVNEVDTASGEALLRDIETTGFSIDNRTPFQFGSLKALLTIGGEWYQDEQVGHDSASSGGVRSGVPNGEDAFWGIFGQIEATVERPLGAPGKLMIIPGIRYDSFEASSTGYPDKEETAVSPKIAATYQPADWFFVFGNMGKAFRAPGINELYLTGTHFSLPHPCYLFNLPSCPGGLPDVVNSFVPNPSLEPETSKYWEAGAGFSFDNVVTADDRVRVKGSYWQQNVDDFINLAVTAAPSSQCFFPPYLPCNFGTATANNVDAELSGTEIEARYDSDRWLVTVGYGTVDGKERGTNFDVTGLPADRFTTSVTLKLPEVDGRIGARMEIGSDYAKNYNPVTSDPSTEVRDGYTTFDVFASWLPDDDILNGALRGLRVDVGVENVGDTDYERTFEGVSEPGRNFKTLVSYTVQFR
ncbi:MAG: TonB-dependent receptor [Alphaproteobacteria bacterium]|nr:TonB-dependent receptor [Alphaproteobacteria bacterium]